MRKRFFRKAVLAAVIAVPAVFSHPDSRALAQEEGKAIEREKEAAGAEQQELWESEEEMENISEDTGEEEDTGSEDATDLENQMDAEGDEGFFTENDLFSEMEEDDLLFSEGEEAVPEENMENLIELYAAPAGFVQEGLPARNGNGGFVADTNCEAVFSSKYTRLAGIPIPQCIPGVRLEAVCLPGKRYRERYRVRIICLLITVQKENTGFGLQT